MDRENLFDLRSGEGQMRTSRFTDEQIIGIVREYEAGAKLTELCRRHNISPTTFYKWRAKYGGMAVSADRRLHALLRRESFAANHKLVERLYREEKLAIRRRGRQKRGAGIMAGHWCPIAANQRWSLDFTEDGLANGRKFRTANLKDDCTRECPAILVDFSLPGQRVVAM